MSVCTELSASSDSCSDQWIKEMRKGLLVLKFEF